MIKYGSIFFEDWTPAGDNFFKSENYDLMSCLLLVVESKNVPINERRWRIRNFGQTNSSFIKKLYIATYGDLDYTYSQLDEVKKSIDEFIIRLDNLRIFE